MKKAYKLVQEGKLEKNSLKYIRFYNCFNCFQVPMFGDELVPVEGRM